MNPFTLLLISAGGWMNRNQQDVLAYLEEEIRVSQWPLADGTGVCLYLHACNAGRGAALGLQERGTGTEGASPAAALRGR